MPAKLYLPLDTCCLNVPPNTSKAPILYRLLLYFDDVILVYGLVSDPSLLIGKGPDSL